jgi:hypothetical protein
VLATFVQEAAAAACHAAWQGGAAGAPRAARADDEHGAYGADHPHVVARAAEASQRAALATLECLLTAWLAHAVAFPKLRLPRADMARALVEHPDVQAVKGCNGGYVALLVDRLVELRTEQEELAEHAHAAIGARAGAEAF